MNGQCYSLQIAGTLPKSLKTTLVEELRVLGCKVQLALLEDTEAEGALVRQSDGDRSIKSLLQVQVLDLLSWSGGGSRNGGQHGEGEGGLHS